MFLMCLIFNIYYLFINVDLTQKFGQKCSNISKEMYG